MGKHIKINQVAQSSKNILKKASFVRISSSELSQKKIASYPLLIK